jgi:hypothetical protein
MNALSQHITNIKSSLSTIAKRSKPTPVREQKAMYHPSLDSLISSHIRRKPLYTFQRFHQTATSPLDILGYAFCLHTHRNVFCINNINARFQNVGIDVS